MKVKFVPQNVEFEIKPGEPVMHVAQDHGLYIKSVCKGVPSCAECRIRIVDGEHNVLPPGTEELSLIGSGYFIDRRRLSCQLKCYGDIVVDMTEQIQKEQGLIGGRKSKKAQAKDDRVEAVVARRGEDNEGPEVVDPVIEGGETTPQPPRERSQAERPPQRDQRPQQRDPRPPRGDRPQRDQRPQGAAGPARPQGQGPQRGPQPPRPPGDENRPTGGEGGEGGARRRRRRRGGKGRGGGGAPGGGGPSSGPGGG